MESGSLDFSKRRSSLVRLGSGRGDWSAGQMPSKMAERRDGACWPRKLLIAVARRAEILLAWISRCSKDGAGLHKRREEAMRTSNEPPIMNDLVLEICGAKCRSTSGSCGEFNFTLMSTVADFDRWRYASARSTSSVDRNWMEVQRDGQDTRVERQY